MSSTANHAPAKGIKSVVLLYMTLALAVILVGVSVGASKARSQRQSDIERLQAIGDLKVGQISAWLNERKSDAETVRNDDSLVTSYKDWLVSRSPESRSYVRTRLSKYRGNDRYVEVAIVGPGRAALSTSNDQNGSINDIPAIRDLISRTSRLGVAQVSDLYRSDESIYLDIAVPLTSDNYADSVILVMRIDPSRFLFPYIQYWPIPSVSAETLLFERDGEHVLFLNELRHRANTALDLRVPVDHPDLLAAQVLRGEGVVDGYVEGVDYRGVPVLGVVKRVPDTPWYLVTKIDKQELYSGAQKEYLLIALTVLLVLIIAAATTVYFYHSNEIRHLASQRKEQEEKIRVLRLMEAMAEGSRDLIYAKSESGTYLFANRNFAKAIGKSVSEIIGKTDNAVFGSGELTQRWVDDERAMRAGYVITEEESLPTIGGRRMFETTRGPLTNDEDVIGVFSICRDVTDYRFQEREVRTTQAKLRAVMNGLGRALFIVDLDTNSIVDANSAAADMLGMRPVEIKGCPAFATEVSRNECCSADAAELDPISVSLEVIDTAGMKTTIHATGHRVELMQHHCLVCLAKAG